MSEMQRLTACEAEKYLPNFRREELGSRVGQNLAKVGIKVAVGISRVRINQQNE